MQVKPFPVYTIEKTVRYDFFIQNLAENIHPARNGKSRKCGMAASPGLYFEGISGVF